MIQVGAFAVDPSDPVIWAALAAMGGGVIVIALLIGTVRSSARAVRVLTPLQHHLSHLGARVEKLSDGQERLTGGLTHVAEAQAVAQSQMLATMERRLEEVTKSMGDSLHGQATRTARTLGELQERLAAIDKAQANIEKLSGDVLSLQDILSNKQTRGAFGEIQLNDIVGKALPKDSYSLQATLSNGRRADCLIHLPNPPGPIVIDSKFPLEAYEALRAAEDERALQDASRAFRGAVRGHLRAIADKYILDGETADGALMFLPSEAVYAELHSNFPELVREGFGMRVWTVSPTTCMATLNTMRAVLKDVRMREQAGHVRKELALLAKDVERLGDRVGNLDRHFGQVQKDLGEIRISADKAAVRAKRLDSFEFDEVGTPEIEARPTPVIDRSAS